MRWTWLIGPALLGACYGDPDRFNEKQAELLCRLEDKCGGDFGVDAEPGSTCEDTRIDELSMCTSACEYDEDAARSCIRGIKHALRGGVLGPNCEFEEGTIDDCARVYTDCEETLEDPLSCDVPEPDLSCAIDPDARTPWALALLGLAAALRYRRRRA
jgi:MYXO-CTERM domain-containing protein